MGRGRPDAGPLPFDLPASRFDNGTHTALAEANEGEVRREEAGNRYCIVLLLSLLSGLRQDVCRCIVAHVRTDGCPWTHRIGC
jgi:hypothetical protein